MRPPAIYTPLTEFWGWDEREKKVFWRALEHATWTKAVGWRQHLAFYVQCKLTPPRVFLNTVCAPSAMIDVIEELTQEGRLTREQATALSEGILNATGKDGCWRDHRNPAPRRRV